MSQRIISHGKSYSQGVHKVRDFDFFYTGTSCGHFDGGVFGIIDVQAIHNLNRNSSTSVRKQLRFEHARSVP